MYISLGIPSAFCFLGLECRGISVFCRVVPILASICFPLSPFGKLLSLLCRGLLGLGSGFGGAGLADNRADLLCGSSFTFALSPLASPFAFLFGMVAAVLAGGLSSPGGCFCPPHTAPGKMSESRGRPRGTGIPAEALDAPEP